MRKEYDFSKSKRGPVAKTPPGKERITLQIDSDILNWLRKQIEDAGGGNYHDLINTVLRAHIQNQELPQERISAYVRGYEKYPEEPSTPKQNKHIGSDMGSLFDELDEQEELDLLTREKVNNEP